MKKFLASLLFLLVMAVPAFAGFIAGTYGSTDPILGWAQFTDKATTNGQTCASGLADGSCYFYFDTGSTGASCALTTAGDLTHLCKTIAQAMAVYGGRNGKADRFLFKQGQTWNDGQNLSDDGVSCCWSKSGFSTTDLLVLSSYDAAQPTVINPATGTARPRIFIKTDLPVGNSRAMQCQGDPSACKNMAIVGLDFNAIDCDPSVTGRSTQVCGPSGIVQGQLNTPGFTYLEDVRFTWFNQAYGPQGLATNETILVRRSQFLNSVADNIEGGAGLSKIFTVQESVIHGGSNGQFRYTGATISTANPGVVSVANGIPNNGTGIVYFDSTGGGITAGQANTYFVLDNNFSTFSISASAPNSVQGNTNSSTTITNINVSGMAAGQGVNCATCGSSTASPTTISSVPSNFGITGNTHTTTTIDGIASTTGIFGGSVVLGNDYVFTVNAATANAGDTYTNNGQTFTVKTSIVGGTTLTTTGTGAPNLSGSLNLVRTSGSGTNPIVATSTSSVVGPTNANVVTVNVNSIVVDSAAVSTITGVSFTVTPNAIVMSRAATDTAQHTITTFARASLVSTLSGPVSPQAVTFWSFQPTAFLHNIYASDINTNNGNFYGKLDFRGNIFGYEGIGAVQGRPGGLIQNNAYVLESAGTNMGSYVNSANTFDGNVFLGAKLWATGGPAFGYEVGSSNNNGRLSGVGTFSVTNNISANSIESTLSSNSFNTASTINYSGNIVYNWNSPALFDTCCLTSGGIQTMHFTSGGSGLTDSVVDITAIGTDSFGNVVLTTSQDMRLAFACCDSYTAWYVVGMTNSGGTCGLNNNAWFGQIPLPLGPPLGPGNVHTVNLYAPASTTNCAVNLGVTKLYFPTFGTTPGLTCNPNPAGCHNGASATGASTQYISVGGSLVALVPAGSEGDNPQAGQGYTAGDTLLLNAGSGVAITVDSVSAITNLGNNKFDPTGTNSFGFPGCSAPGSSTSPNTCTAAKYYDHLQGSGGHTDLDFLTAAMNNFKGNWNPALTANNGLVPWVQAGFGFSGSTGVRGLSLGKGL